MVTTARRGQLNITGPATLPLWKELDRARRLTGHDRTYIARETLESFLPAWVAAELAKKKVITEVRERTASVAREEAVERAGGVVLREVPFEPRASRAERSGASYAAAARERQSIPELREHVGRVARVVDVDFAPRERT